MLRWEKIFESLFSEVAGIGEIVSLWWLLAFSGSMGAIDAGGGYVPAGAVVSIVSFMLEEVSTPVGC